MSLALDTSADVLGAVDLTNEALCLDPYPFYKRMREESPVFYSRRYRQYFAFSAQAVRTVLASKSFTVDSPFRASRVLFGRTIVDIEGDDHRRLRAILGATINVKKTADYRERIFEPTVLDCLAALQPGASQDWVDLFCNLVPVNVMAQIIGIPRSEFKFFRDCSIPIIEFLDLATAETKKHAVARHAELSAFLRDLLSRPDEISPDTVIGSMLAQRAAGEEISDDEIIRQTALLIPAAIDTTNRLIATAIFFMARDQELQDQLRQDPQQLLGFVNEILRFEPPIHTTVRLATDDVEVEGCTIRRGGIVSVNLASANRDTAVFEDPDRFDVRRDASKHLSSFGAGKHQCVGRALALVEVTDCLALVLKHCGPFRIDPDAPAPRIYGIAFRSPPALPIIFDRNHQGQVQS